MLTFQPSASTVGKVVLESLSIGDSRSSALHTDILRINVLKGYENENGLHYNVRDTLIFGHFTTETGVTCQVWILVKHSSPKCPSDEGLIPTGLAVLIRIALVGGHAFFKRGGSLIIVEPIHRFVRFHTYFTWRARRRQGRDVKEAESCARHIASDTTVEDPVCWSNSKRD